MKAGGLVVEHHVVGTRNAHEIIAAGGGEQKHQVVGGVLIGDGVIGVADVAAHRESQQFPHEVIFQAGANDLALVVEIFRADEADNGVDEERIERTGNAIGARFQRQLVDAVMRVGGERASLPRFEIHHVVAAPGHIARPVMIQNTLAAFPQHREINAEALVRCLRAGDGLEQQIDRRAVIQTRQLGGDMREATCLRRDGKRRDEAIDCFQDGADRFDGIGGGIHSDDGVSAPVHQAVKRRQQNAADIVGGVVGLQTNAEDAALADGVPATRDVANLCRREHQILVAHQFRGGRGHFRRNAPFEGL